MIYLFPPFQSLTGVRGIPSNFGYVDLLEMVNSRAAAADAMKENKNVHVRPAGAAYVFRPLKL
jgi:hypothetical protein